MGAVVMRVYAACLTLWAASVAAQTATITCFYTLPIAPGQRPAATPLVFKRRDGYEVCMRYQYKCSLNNPACLAQEAQLGVWKWHYMAASRSGCLSVAAAARATDSSIRSVLCCSSSRCNMPDRTRDPATQLVLDSWLSRSTTRPTRASAVTAAAPQPSTISAATVMSPAAVPQALPAPAPPRTVTPLMAAVVPANVAAGNDGLLNAVERTQDPKAKPAVIATGDSSSSSTNSNPKNAARFDGRNLDRSVTSSSSSSNSSDQVTSTSNPPSSGSGGSSGGGTITCYIAYPWAPGQDVPQTPAVYSAQFSTKDGYETCAKFSYECIAAAGTCTPAEVKQGVYRTTYSALSKATCASMKSSSGFFRDVTCCESMNCNKPEPGTQVLPAPVLTSA